MTLRTNGRTFRPRPQLRWAQATLITRQQPASQNFSTLNNNTKWNEIQREPSHFKGIGWSSRLGDGAISLKCNSLVRDNLATSKAWVGQAALGMVRSHSNATLTLKMKDINSKLCMIVNQFCGFWTWNCMLADCRGGVGVFKKWQNHAVCSCFGSSGRISFEIEAVPASSSSRTADVVIEQRLQFVLNEIAFWLIVAEVSEFSNGTPAKQIAIPVGVIVPVSLQVLQVVVQVAVQVRCFTAGTKEIHLSS